MLAAQSVCPLLAMAFDQDCPFAFFAQAVLVVAQASVISKSNCA
jgi:hypothetical protein